MRARKSVPLFGVRRLGGALASRRSPKIVLIVLFFEILCSSVTAKPRTVITVAADGTGDFKTVQQAIDRVPDNSHERVVIQIKPGRYEEQVRINSNKRSVTLRGEDAVNTVLTYRLSAQQAGNTRLAFSTFVNANDFRAENITFENSFGTGSQAVALLIDADRGSFFNCRFLGWQDTLFINGGRHFFKSCYIEGHVDFIFGSAKAFFDSCHIHSKGAGYITAHFRTDDGQPTGFVFYRCRLTGSDTGSGVYLGRPWRPFARVIFIECWLDSHIKEEGWDNWRDPAREKTARFAEYQSKGPGANAKKRVAWSKQLTATEAKMFYKRRFLAGEDKWLP